MKTRALLARTKNLTRYIRITRSNVTGVYCVCTFSWGNDTGVFMNKILWRNYIGVELLGLAASGTFPVFAPDSAPITVALPPGPYGHGTSSTITIDSV